MYNGSGGGGHSPGISQLGPGTMPQTSLPLYGRVSPADCFLSLGKGAKKSTFLRTGGLLRGGGGLTEGPSGSLLILFLFAKIQVFFLKAFPLQQETK